MANKPNWSRQDVGTSGRRRIVPVLGVGYIAGQIAIKNKPYTGEKKASIGGRTRYWSSVNFLNVSTGRYIDDPNAQQIAQRERFGDTSTFTKKTMMNPQTLNAAMTDFKAGNIAHGIDPADCLNLRYYVWQAAYSFAAGGGTLPDVATWPLQ